MATRVDKIVAASRQLSKASLDLGYAKSKTGEINKRAKTANEKFVVAKQRFDDLEKALEETVLHAVDDAEEAA